MEDKIESFQIFNVLFIVQLKNKYEEDDFIKWINLMLINPERLRISYILAWLEGRGINYITKWSYCKKLSCYYNWKAFWGYRKQIRDLKFRIKRH